MSTQIPYEQFVDNLFSKRTSDKIDADQAFKMMFTVYQSIKPQLDLLDQLKKHLYYGKDLSSHVPPISVEAAKNYTAFSNNPAYSHAILGMLTEVFELLESLEENKGDVNLGEELGDVNFYLTAALNESGLSLENVVEANMNKLNARYKSGSFSETEAINRNTAEEEKILTKSLSSNDN
jgi:NTP pyrophosphatase (non-canonical NTP hydrolase)